MKAHLFYVEDDPSLSFVTKDNLEMNGFLVSYFSDGISALNAFREGQFDLCILDVMLPEMDGFELAAQIRKRNSDIPIIFLTAKSLKEDKLQGLRLGADDYITKPFSIEELLLKIEIFLRRSKIMGETNKATIFTLGAYQFDYTNLALIHENDEPRILTQKEADVLLYFINHKNQVVKRSAILENVWGEDDYFLGRSLDVFISRLRKYLMQDSKIQLENIHGVGFKLKV